jgi:hypothetical protein
MMWDMKVPLAKVAASVFLVESDESWASRPDCSNVSGGTNCAVGSEHTNGMSTVPGCALVPTAGQVRMPLGVLRSRSLYHSSQGTAFTILF